MTLPPPGVAFSEAQDGDVRNDAGSLLALSRRLGIDPHWATVRQVHGAVVVRATDPGVLGGADALFTTVPDLPVAVFTADCFGVVLHARGAVGVAHAGWRGAGAEVVQALIEAMTLAGHVPTGAQIGPGIGPCCFEVGPEVLEVFPGHVASTTWGTPSVDLVGVITDQLVGIQTEVAGGCTRHDPRYFSYRRDQTRHRQVALGWLP